MRNIILSKGGLSNMRDENANANSVDGDRRERRNMLGAAMMGMLGQMAHRDRDDDDDE
jgi:hypothetical protein